jgi:hypothetical protein
MRRCFLSLAFARFGFAAAVAAEDAVTLKLAEPKPENRVRVSQSEKTRNTRTTTVNGKKTAATDQNSTAWVYIGEIVPKGKDEPPNVTRTYQKYQVVTGGKVEAGPPLNDPITIEKKGDGFALSAGKKELPPAFVKRLEAELSPATSGVAAPDMLPKTPVKPGDTWTIDATKAFGGTGKLALDADRGTMTGKLLKVYKKGDRQFATMEFAARAPIKSLGPDVGLIPKDGSVAELKLTVEACIDGSEPFSRTTGTVTLRAEADIPGGTVQLISETRKSETIELVPKK